MRMRRMKDVFLKATAGITGMTFLASACMLDSESWIPVVVCVACALYLAAFAYANGAFCVGGEEEW